MLYTKNEIILGDLDCLDPDDDKTESLYQKPYMVNPQLVVIPIIGSITRYDGGGNASTEAILKKIKFYETKGVSIILKMDSGGGSASSLFELTQYIKNLKVPISAWTSDFCASAAFLIASSCNSHTTSPNASVGSVGAIMVTSDITQKDMGLKSYRSAISPDKNPEPGKKKDSSIQKRVDDIGIAFVADLADSLKISEDVIIETFGKGDMVQAKDALQRGMISAVEITFEQFLNKEKNKMNEKEIAEMKTAHEALVLKLEAEKTTMQTAHDLEMKNSHESATVLECKRQTDISSLAIPGHEELVESMKADPKCSYENAAVKLLHAEKATREVAMAALATDVIQPLESTTPTNVDLSEFGGDQDLFDEYQAAEKAFNIK